MPEPTPEQREAFRAARWRTISWSGRAVQKLTRNIPISLILCDLPSLREVPCLEPVRNLTKYSWIFVLDPRKVL
ncbi:MAG: hypothetical protein RLY93_02040 [Sumerlaeia bacterium]